MDAKWSTRLIWGASALAIFGAWKYSRAQALCDGEFLTKLPGRWDSQRLRLDHPWLMSQADVLALQVGDPVVLAYADTFEEGVGPKTPTRVFLMPSNILEFDGLMGSIPECYVRTELVTEGTLIGLGGDNKANLASKFGAFLRPDTPTGAVTLADLF